MGDLYVPRAIARCPNRAATVRAYNWVVLGALLHEPEKPARFLPTSGRLYFRKSQLPVGPDGIVAFRTKCELAIELLREQARIIKGKHLAVFDGGYALKSVVRPLVLPEGGRLGSNSSPACGAMPGCMPCPCPRSSTPRGSRTEAQVGSAAGAAPPGRHVEGEVAGRNRLRLRPAAGDPLEGDHLPVAIPGLGGASQGNCCLRRGYKERFTLVTSAVELTGLQMVELRGGVPAEDGSAT